MIFLMHVATIQHLNYKGQECKKTRFAVYISDTPVTLKQGQHHQSHHENVDPDQGQDHAKFERSHFHGV